MNSHRDINSFKNYLQAKNYTDSTVKSYLKIIQRYKTWIGKEALTAPSLTTEKVVSYLHHLRKASLKARTISNHLCVLRYYLDYLGVVPNPLQYFIYHTPKQRLPHQLLTQKQLQDLYKAPLVSLKYEVLRSLLIEQAIASKDVALLQIQHLLLDKGEILIPARKKSNARKLPLTSFQVDLLYAFLKEDHLKNQSPQTHLFPQNTSNPLTYLREQLNKACPFLTKIAQIRSSVLTLWLKQQDVRIVQYKAGHRYVSSTERYQTADLEALRHQLAHSHPLGK
ncbi:MAG: phage integrase N-terminal SAM-like domain-containing protein [Bacteroidota bacterium]